MLTGDEERAQYSGRGKRGAFAILAPASKESPMDLDLHGRTALVSGSHRGTGQIIAARLAAEGARVLVHGMRPGQAEAAVAELGCGHAVTGDITTDAGADAVAEACAGERVDILINNYGTADAGSWEDSDSGDWIRAYQHNVLSAVRLTRRFLPPMRERGWGRIINLGTVGSTRPAARMPHYYAAKGALATATISLAKAVADSGVRVNLVSPGLILTPEVEAAYLARGRREGWGDDWQAVEPRVAADIPIRRIARREEVADLIAYLASPLADAVHGQNIRIDGGALGTLT
jgi:3-oxoacyl-[acyl-carrier protein] reductase